MFLITVTVAHSADGGEEGKTQDFFFFYRVFQLSPIFYTDHLFL